MGNLYTNKVKQSLRQNQKVIAAWEHLGSSLSAELLAQCGYDTVIVDMEHSPADISQLPSMVQAISSAGAVPMARAPWNDMVLIKKMLDCGIQGILIPYISNREEAEAAVSYCKYPPEGVRGYSRSTKAVYFGINKGDYTHRINDELLILVAIESRRGVENAEEIASVKGIDGLFIGPADLSVSMGHMDEPNHPEVMEAIDRIEKAAHAHGKIVATIPYGNRTVSSLFHKGYSLVVAFSDCVHLCQAAKATADAFKSEFR